MIDAGNLLRLAALLEAQERAAVRAAVLEAVERAPLVARHHHRHAADESRLEVARVGQLGFEPQEIPGRSAVDALLLARVDALVLVHPIRDAREPLGGPSSGFGHFGHEFERPILTP